MKIRARAQCCHSLPPATTLTPVLVAPGLVLARSGSTTEQEAEPVLAGKERQGHRDPLNSSEPEAEEKKKKFLKLCRRPASLVEAWLLGCAASSSGGLKGCSLLPGERGSCWLEVVLWVRLSFRRSEQEDNEE